MATNLGTAIGYLTLDITGFTRGIDEATRQIDRMGTASSSKFSQIGSAATKVGTVLTAAVTAPIVGFGASVLKEGTTFEEAMTEVKNVANLSASDINEFRKAIKSLGFQMVETGNDTESMYKTMYEYAVRQGSETRFTAEEVAKALYYMGLAGWNAADMVRGLRPILDLAAASDEDLATVSDIVTDSMRAMGYTAEDTAMYVNVLAEMMRSSNTTVKQAGEAFKYVAPLAGSLGYNIQDVAIAIGEFANVGVKGSQAGTGLRQALNSLTNPSEKAVEAMKKYNVSLYNVDGSAKSLAEVMAMLREKFGSSVKDVDAVSDAYSSFIASVGDGIDQLSTYEQGLLFREYMDSNGMTNFINDWEKAEAVIRLVGIRALPGILGIINDTDSGFNTLSKSINGAQDSYDGLGSAVGMSNELMDTTRGSIYKLTSSISELRIQLFEFLQGPFQMVIDKLTDAVRWFNNLDDATQKNILKLAGIAAAVGPVILIIGKLLTGISQITTAFKLAGLSKDKFSNNVTGTLNPALKSGEGLFGKLGTAVKSAGSFLASHAKQVGGITSVVTGSFLSVGAAIEGVKQGGFGFKQWLEDIFGGILTAGGLFLAGVTGWVPVIVGAAVSVVSAIIGNWDTIKEFLGNVFSAIGSFLASVWDGITSFLGSAISAIGSAIGSIGSAIGSFLGSLFSGIGSFFGNLFSTIGSFFGNIISSIGSWLGNIFSNIGSWFTGLISSIGSWFGSIFSSLSSLIGDVVDTIASAGAAIFDGISNVFSMIGDGISSLASFFMDIFSSLLSGVMSALSAIGSAIGGFISGIVSTITNTISSIVGFIGGLAESIGSALMGVFDTISSFFSSFISKLGDVLSGIGNWIGGVISNIGGFIGSMWEGLTSIVTDFGKGIWDVIGSVGSGISSLIGSVGKGLGTLFSNIGSTIYSGVKGVINSIADGFSGMWDSVVNIGKNIITGIWEGISSAASWLFGGIGDICSGIVNGVKSLFKIKSPSKVMADEVGRWLPLGIAEGFEETMPEAERDINNSVDDMIDGVNADDNVVTISTSYSDLQTVMAKSYNAFADAVETTEYRLNASLDNMYEKMYNLTMLNQQLSDGIISSTGYNVTNTTTGNGTAAGSTTNNNTGNTFIFNSPKAIDEIEAARQLEKTQRDIEEGFIY